MTLIKDKNFDAERALYASDSVMIENCTFSGIADGESALKESKNITVRNCRFELRYPFWHDNNLEVENCVLTSTCRAALWYTADAHIKSTTLGGIKALRECENIKLTDCTIDSTEFGWKCKNIEITSGNAQGEYFFFGTSNAKLENFSFSGKYSFQYCNNITIKNCILRTKDAFWHTKDVTVYDSVIEGEYLGWYSENLRLVRCKISGTQPLCYAKNLVLEDCTMDGCDLSFEYSSVNAVVTNKIDSVKNPASGRIEAADIGQIILDEHQKTDTHCEIILDI